MIEIRNSYGLVLELDRNFSMPVERYNPLFNDPDKFFQDIIYSGKAELTPGNKFFIQYGNRVDTSNDAYSLQCSIIKNSYKLFDGFFQYKIIDDKIDFTFKVNFASIADKVKKTRLPEIRTNDENFNTGGNLNEFKSFMKSTCTTPQNYPYAFLPVYNDQINGSENPKVVNDFDFGSQSFNVTIHYDFFNDPNSMTYPYDKISYECPFFKLTYILKTLFRYLGFEAAGNFFNSPEADTIYIYTQRALDNDDNQTAQPRKVLDCMTYMPDITIAEFLKQVRERFHLAMDFDLANKEVRLNHYNADQEIKDISEYFESVKQLEVSSVKGKSVFLKPDENDANFQVEDQYLPTYKLVIGDGEESVEIAAGTLKARVDGARKFVSAHQYILNDVSIAQFGGYPPPRDSSTYNAWPLRFIKYNGMKLLEPGKYWPESEPLELNSYDAGWYRLLSDSKALQLIANLPTVVLRDIGPTDIISFSTEDLSTFPCMIKKITYDLGETTDITKVEFDAISIKNEIKTVFSFTPGNLIFANQGVPMGVIAFVKAYFDPAKISFTEISPQVFSSQGTYSVEKIIQSTDFAGAGGNIAAITQTSTISFPDSFELRIYEAPPKYALYFGIKYFFTKTGNYWSVTFQRKQRSYMNSIWIVF